MRTFALTTLLFVVGNAASFSYNKDVLNGTTLFQIQWSNCTTNDPPNLDCGQIQVPLDWSQPDGEQITLGISRVKATGSSSSRVGSLIFNPGGPGSPATEFCEYQAAGTPVFSKAISEHFDIICPDPRGVGTSSPISCDPGLWNQKQSLFPQSEAEFAEMVKHNKAFGQSCLDLSGGVFSHVDTTSVAEDMEAIRIALNDGKLNWLGVSYGTQIGAQYAELYPKNIRAMALDGNTDHSPSEVYILTAESSTYENELDRFFEWCNQNQSCAFHGQNVAQIFDDLVAKADKTPIPAPGCLPTADTAAASTCFPNVTGEDIRFNVQGSLTYKYGSAFPGGGWLELGIVLNETLNGNATALSSAMANMGKNSTVWQGLAVGCLDWAHSTTTFAQNVYKQQLGSAIAPHTKGASQSYRYQTRCIGWPATVVNPPHVLNQTAMKLAPPILLVNSNHDPETSYVWAQNLQTQIPSAVLVTRNGDGHGSLVLGGQASAVIDGYLVNGTLPAQDFVVQS
ncbi:hypothetical protein LTR10_016086 [Elasticomyces elasticus]|uniref:AB hydrolase-1 domain-containing protein n=1 Tax=Exophiala sideris TaxID=1016849 RepID=A0ABR0J1I0_9EURO|nr:hypothetical protein LTR10_016086 [Elasticomyces elasticus]KAK5024577.1 hypothetical protein LTS07_008423 [Exophiala sideris]KAK5030671.1 hypothetical protein LTR13_008025 [Exophiala sideris]KAK5054210.1 hypothetical protein LTR69_008825 [Exophiala sideris]KAK5179612.1 hypothetical protein LTR44_007780 [Eurotiomycetes sp. CCFEE 6388]